jgi:hypothetical protein
LRRCFLLWVGEPVLTPRPERGAPGFREPELRESVRRESAFRAFELREFENRESEFRALELRELERWLFELREPERWLFELREPEPRAFALRPLPVPRSGGTRHSGP